eukprot:scaffold840_cov344-Pavlova_lutheri.AAC.135
MMEGMSDLPPQALPTLMSRFPPHLQEFSLAPAILGSIVRIPPCHTPWQSKSVSDNILSNYLYSSLEKVAHVTNVIHGSLISQGELSLLKKETMYM